MIKVPDDMVTDRYYPTNNYGRVKIINYFGCKKVSVLFEETETIGFFHAGDIRRGVIKDPTIKRVCRHLIPDGFKEKDTIFIPKYNSSVVILRVENANNVFIKFISSGYTVKVSRYDLKNGKVRDPYQEDTSGICDIPKSTNTKIHSLWKGMLARVAGNKPCYTDTKVCNEWLYFSNFKGWVEKQDYEGKVLDKDLASRGELIYSPATCNFIPPLINAVLTTFRKGDTSGCYFNKDKGLWQSQMTEVSTGKVVYLGRYNTKEEASEVFMENKINSLRLWIHTIEEEHLRELLIDWLAYKTRIEPVVHETRLCDAQGNPKE